MSVNQEQNILITMLKDEFKEVKEAIKACALKEDVLKQQDLIDNHCLRVRQLETSSASEKEILSNVEKCSLKLSEQVDFLIKRSITKEHFDRMLEVNQADIGANRKKIREIEGKQAITWTRLSIVWVALTMIGIAILNFIIDLFKKKIGG